VNASLQACTVQPFPKKDNDLDLCSTTASLAAWPQFAVRRALQWLKPPDNPEQDDREEPNNTPLPGEGEDLPFKVELWDEAKNSVEQVLAITANGSIGYAAFYAATREFPHRYVTLRHKHSIVSRWNGPRH
jgi:hypothetical protein